MIPLLLLMAQTAPEDPIVATAVVNAPVKEVWRAFTTTEGVTSWMVAKAEVDLRVGGHLRTSYDKSSNLNDDKTIENTILAYDPERMLTIKVAKAPAGFPFKTAVQQMWTVIYFEPVGTKTKVTCRGLGFTADPESQSLKKFFQQGNEMTMQSLVKRFAGDKG